jgi:hypothetical protein
MNLNNLKSVSAQANPKNPTPTSTNLKFSIKNPKWVQMFHVFQTPLS